MDIDSVTDRVKGMFVAVLLGDALGAPHELKSNKDNVYTGKLEVRSRRFNRYEPDPTKRETFGPVGAITDDSEMTLTLLASIVRNNGFNRDDVLSSYLTWAASGCKCLGTNTRAILGGGSRGNPLGLKGYNNHIGKVLLQPDHARARGNGSAMRASPLALLRNWWSACEGDSTITNPNTTNIAASRVYVYLLRSILLNNPPGDRYNNLMKNLHHLPEDVKQIITDRRERDVSGPTRGFVLHALHFAITAVDWNGSFSSLMDYIIPRPYTDTDTNAAIAGAVLGARMGFRAMMEEPITRENYRIMMTSEWLQQRPREYSATYLDDLIPSAVKILMTSF